MNANAILERGEADAQRFSGYVDRLARFRFQLVGNTVEPMKGDGTAPGFDKECFTGKVANLQMFNLEQLNKFLTELEALERFFPQESATPAALGGTIPMKGF